MLYALADEPQGGAGCGGVFVDAACGFADASAGDLPAERVGDDFGWSAVELCGFVGDAFGEFGDAHGSSGVGEHGDEIVAQAAAPELSVLGARQRKVGFHAVHSLQGV